MHQMAEHVRLRVLLASGMGSTAAPAVGRCAYDPDYGSFGPDRNAACDADVAGKAVEWLGRRPPCRRMGRDRPQYPDAVPDLYGLFRARGNWRSDRQLSRSSLRDFLQQLGLSDGN